MVNTAFLKIRTFIPRLTVLDRYLINEFIGPFLLAICGFAVIAIVDIVFYLVELAVISGVSFFIIIRLLIYKLPAVMILFFPMAVLFAVMLILVRMAKDNEITVLRISGINILRLAVPLIILALIASLLSYITNEKIVPWTNKVSDNMINYEIQKTPPLEIVENMVFKDSVNRFFYIKKVDAKSNKMENILIFEETDNYPRILTAKKAYWQKNMWMLQDGFAQEFNDNGAVEFIDHFSEMVINVDTEFQEYYRQKTAQQMNSQELKDKINILSKSGLSTRALKVEYYMKQSFPIACFVFGLVGIAFCFTFVRSGKDWWGVIFAICMSVLLVAFYFFMVALFRAFAKDNMISPVLGAWLPNIIYGTIAIIAIIYNSYHK